MMVASAIQMRSGSDFKPELANAATEIDNVNIVASFFISQPFGEYSRASQVD
jgi:hypothetical protein